MGLDITVCRCHAKKCPHCGKPFGETIIDQVDSCGRFWVEYLEEIGYYVPYEIREKEPERDFYGKDMTLTTEQAKRLAAFAKAYDLYNWAIIAELVDRAIENGSFVVINADW